MKTNLENMHYLDGIRVWAVVSGNNTRYYADGFGDVTAQYTSSENYVVRHHATGWDTVYFRPNGSYVRRGTIRGRFYAKQFAALLAA